MTLKINGMYKIAGGYLIPRSHWSEDASPLFAVFEILTTDGTKYTKKHTTLTIKECRKILKLAKNEGVQLI